MGNHLSSVCFKEHVVPKHEHDQHHDEKKDDHKRPPDCDSCVSCRGSTQNCKDGIICDSRRSVTLKLDETTNVGCGITAQLISLNPIQVVFNNTTDCTAAVSVLSRLADGSQLTGIIAVQPRSVSAGTDPIAVLDFVVTNVKLYQCASSSTSNAQCQSCNCQKTPFLSIVDNFQVVLPGTVPLGCSITASVMAPSPNLTLQLQNSGPCDRVVQLSIVASDLSQGSFRILVRPFSVVSIVFPSVVVLSLQILQVTSVPVAIPATSSTSLSPVFADPESRKYTLDFALILQSRPADSPISIVQWLKNFFITNPNPIISWD